MQNDNEQQTPSVEQAAQAVRAAITRLQKSPQRIDRCQAQALGELLGAHARGRIGDCAIHAAAVRVGGVR